MLQMSGAWHYNFTADSQVMSSINDRIKVSIQQVVSESLWQLQATEFADRVCSDAVTHS